METVEESQEFKTWRERKERVIPWESYPDCDTTLFLFYAAKAIASEQAANAIIKTFKSRMITCRSQDELDKLYAAMMLSLKHTREELNNDIKYALTQLPKRFKQ